MRIFGEESENEKNNIGKRASVLYFAVILLFFCTIMSVFTSSQSSEYREVVIDQSSFKLNITSKRGTIYDSSLKPITNAEEYYSYAVIPSVESLNLITEKFGNAYLSQFEEGKPFVITSDDYYDFDSDYIDVIKCYKRYDETASNLIGYLDYDGQGVTGIEKYYNDVLSSYSGDVSINYIVNAQTEVMSMKDKTINDNIEDLHGGVVLTLDKKLQNACEEICKKYLTTGALIVSDIKTGKIRAIVSYPPIVENDITSSLNDKNSPFTNRAFSPYIPGSVYKLVSAAAALESGAEIPTNYTCNAYEQTSNSTFWCYNHISHGDNIDLKTAISKSCNCYFINLTKNIDSGILHTIAQKFGFGESINLIPGITTAGGDLPSANDIENENAKALFSFGQGGVTVTPLEVASMINTIADNGYKKDLSLIEGVVDNNLNYKIKYSQPKSTRVISQTTAQYIKDAMHLCATEGTGKSGKPDNLTAACKTGTAQTGVITENNDEIVNFWYAGFYPYENPKYSIVVLADNQNESSTSPCAKVFKDVSNYLYDNYVK